MDLLISTEYKRFIHDFSRLVKPSVSLARKDTPSVWSEACAKGLEQQVFKAPILKHLDPKGQSLLDASDRVTGGIVSQYDDDGVLHPVTFYSKSMIRAECNYHIHDKKMLQSYAAPLLHSSKGESPAW